MYPRRTFHQQLACLIGSNIAFRPIPQSAMAAETKPKVRRIVTLFLDGGNDGLNTVIPASDPLYQHFRKDLRIGADEAIKLDRQMFLHPSMRGLAEVWDAGRLHIQQGVGYPNHNRSHFKSIAVWSEGNLDAKSPSFDGWLARSLDPLQQLTNAPLACAIDSVDTPELLRGRFTRTTAVPNISAAKATLLAELLSVSNEKSADTETSRFLESACRDAAKALRRSSASTLHSDDFSKTSLGNRMRQVAMVIDAMPELKAIHVVHDGYDTHASQRGTHAGLLRELSAGLSSLDRYLQTQGLSDSTLVMVFSEFGRRVKENASHGTDHGAAGPMLFMGGGLPGGLFGQNPDLEHLDNGDVSVTRDLRDLYDRITPWLCHSGGELTLPS